MREATIRRNEAKKKAKLGAGFLRWSAKIVRTCVAGTNFTQVLEAVDAGRVAVGIVDLDRVIPNRGGLFRRCARLEHRQQRALRESAGPRRGVFFFLALVFAQRT